MPHLTNTDGEELEFHELCFPFATGVLQRQVAAVLDAVAELSPDGPKSSSWLGPVKGAGTAKGTGPGLALGTFSEGGTVLGALELKGKALILQVNSKERAARGEALVQAAAGDLLRAPLITIQTVDQAMRDDDVREGSQDEEDEIPPEIARQIMQEHFDRHYRDTLDQPIPALGDKTPRQAVRSAAGRKKVVEWLKLIENSSAKHEGSPIAEYDFLWMWEELGVLDERR